MTEQEYLNKRLHMIEKTLTTACTILVKQKEQIESLQLRVEKLEARLNKVYHP